MERELVDDSESPSSAHAILRTAMAENPKLHGALEKLFPGITKDICYTAALEPATGKLCNFCAERIQKGKKCSREHNALLTVDSHGTETCNYFRRI